MAMKGRFYWSDKQNAIMRETAQATGSDCYKCFALIDGKVVEYSEMQSGDNYSGSNWPDAIYLGEGVYHRSERVLAKVPMPEMQRMKALLDICKRELEWPEFIGQ